MSADNPIITKAVVELTFANGITKRIILDDKDVPIDFDVSTNTDVRETTADDASFREFSPGPRQKASVHLAGRGPVQLHIPPAVRSSKLRCGHQYNPEGAWYQCELQTGHEGVHTGEGITWANPSAVVAAPEAANE